MAQLQHPPGADDIPIVLEGGLLGGEGKSQTQYTRLVEEALAGVVDGDRLCRPSVDAAVGAALLGRHYLGQGLADTSTGILHGILPRP